MSNIVSLGEVLWDVTPQQEFLGGAALNFAIHLRRLGHRVSLVSAVGKDRRGESILRRLGDAGLSTAFIHQDAGHPTGWVDLCFDSHGEPEYEIHRPAAYDFPALSPEQFRKLLSGPVDWIYFGTLQQMSPIARQLTERLMKEAPAARRLYDPNLRPRSYSAGVVRQLMELATVVKMTEQEAQTISSMLGTPQLPLQEFCKTYRSLFGWEAICITRGPLGCIMLVGDDYVEADGYNVVVADPVGAGDAFAAAFLHGLASAWSPARIADFANRVAALVVSRPGAVPPWTSEEVNELVFLDRHLT